MKTIVHAINAIEEADEAADVGGLVRYCAECGLSEADVRTLVDMPGPTDLGRIHQLLSKREQPAEEVANGDTGEESADDGLAPSEDSATDDVSES